MTLETDGQAAVYQILLPLVIYQHTVRPDLGDIRVINGSKLMIGLSVDAGIGCGDHRHLVSDLRSMTILGHQGPPGATGSCSACRFATFLPHGVLFELSSTLRSDFDCKVKQGRCLP